MRTLPLNKRVSILVQYMLSGVLYYILRVYVLPISPEARVTSRLSLIFVDGLELIHFKV